MKIIFVILLALLNINITSAKLTISSKGAEGSNATHGKSYNTRASYGHGKNGGNAGKSTPGKDAKSISLTLKDLSKGPVKGQIIIKGKVSDNHIQREVTLDTQEIIFLDASGGRGGNSGHGGHGQAAAHGDDGADAYKTSDTSASRSTVGKDAFNGGIGGLSTAASHGGNAGKIDVTIAIEDVHLSLLVKYNVSGGKGGDAGRYANGGDKGVGGSGGSGTSWTHHYQRGYDTVDDSYTETIPGPPEYNLVSDGNGSYTNTATPTTISVRVNRTKQVPHYEDDYYSFPSARDGDDGLEGQMGGGDISAGLSGKDNLFTYNIKYPNGKIEQYTKPYQLRLLSYNITDENSDGILEPGEKVIISDLLIINNGGVPSPHGKAKIKTFIQTRSGSQVFGEVIIPSLRKGQSKKLSGQFSFILNKSKTIGQDGPMISMASHIFKAHQNKFDILLPN